MPQVMVVARNFMDMVAALPRDKLGVLYDSAFICEAVLRSLPPLAKKYVLQMLYMSTPVAAAAMEEWVLDEYATKHKVAIDRLLQLRIFTAIEVRVDRRKEKEVSYMMNQKFQSNMQNYLVDGGSLPRTPLPPSNTGRLPTVSELEDYALEQWEVKMTKHNLAFETLLAAIDQLISSRKRDSFQHIYDEDIPARSSEFKGGRE